MDCTMGRISKEDLIILERDFGPLCAKKAAEGIVDDGPDDLTEYRDQYKNLFEQIVKAAVNFREESGGTISGPDFSEKFVKSLLMMEGNEAFDFAQDLESPFKISEEEFLLLDKAFGLLCHKAAWEVIKVYRNEEQENIVQELVIAMLRSASQYKRKCYFLAAFEYLEKEGKKDSPLIQCWEGAFLKHKLTRDEEWDFLNFMRSLPSNENKPDPKSNLVIDESAARYIKTCIWNQQKAELKDLGKERRTRQAEISLSENDSWLNVEDQTSSLYSGETSNPLRDELFEGVRKALSERDKRAARTYGILTDPKNELEVFPKTSDYKLKINGVRKRTNQSYKSIRSDINTIKGVMGEELSKHQKRIAETK